MNSKIEFMQKMIEKNFKDDEQLINIRQLIIETLSSLSRYDRLSELEPDIHPSTIEEQQLTKVPAKRKNRFEFFFQRQSDDPNVTSGIENVACFTNGYRMNGESK
jgi:hypothetical protein